MELIFFLLQKGKIDAILAVQYQNRQSKLLPVNMDTPPFSNIGEKERGL